MFFEKEVSENAFTLPPGFLNLKLLLFNLNQPFTIYNFIMEFDLILENTYNFAIFPLITYLFTIFYTGKYSI